MGVCQVMRNPLTFVYQGIQLLWCSILFVVLAMMSPFRKFEVIPIVQIIENNGYQAETHTSVTRDGYHITLFRIRKSKAGREDAATVSSKKKTSEGTPSSPPVVLLWHGLLDSAFTWVMQPPSESLAFMLADKGYDVWLGNNRGTCYSRNHSYLSRSMREYWRFSWDEMALFDLPDSVDYILGKTGKDKLSYVGHSEGTTQAFAGLSVNPQLREKMQCFVALGPVATVGHVQNPFLRAICDFQIDKLLWGVGFRTAFFPPPQGRFRVVLGWFLSKVPWLCDDVIGLIAGKPDGHLGSFQAGVWGEKEPGGTSMMNVCHWAQALRAGSNFQRHDFGKVLNRMVYHADVPPTYKLDNIDPDNSLPKLLLTGERDELVPKGDLEILEKALKVKAQVVSKYNHTDYLWDKTAHQELYPQVVDFIQTNDSENQPQRLKQPE